MKTTISTSIALFFGLGAYAAPAALAPPPSAPVPAPVIEHTCANDTLDIYFAANQTSLTPQAERVIQYVAQTYQACDVDQIVVEGQSGVEGQTIEGASLASARAESVVKALEFAQFDANDIRIESVSDPVDVGADAPSELMNRKATVQISVADDHARYAHLAN